MIQMLWLLASMVSLTVGQRWWEGKGEFLTYTSKHMKKWGTLKQ